MRFEGVGFFCEVRFGIDGEDGERGVVGRVRGGRGFLIIFLGFEC